MNKATKQYFVALFSRSFHRFQLSIVSFATDLDAKPKKKSFEPMLEPLEGRLFEMEDDQMRNGRGKQSIRSHH